MTVGSNRSFRIAAATLLLSASAIVGLASTAGASGACGEYSYGFEGTRLLNDGISGSAGPFSIELPAGTYDVTMRSHDAHDEHPGQDEQTQEQWYFTLDSGYQSPASTDIPNESNDMVDEIGAQAIGDTTSITVHHLGQGGVNSVDVVCVGFTTVVVEEPIILAPVEEPVFEIAPPATVTPPKEIVEAPVVEEPVVEAVVEPPAVEVKAVVEVSAPPVVESQLALTGPSSTMIAMLVAALTLVALGLAQLVGERRSLG